MDATTTVLRDGDDEAVEHVEYRFKDPFSSGDTEYPAGTVALEFDQVRKKRVSTIFGVKMDTEALDKHIEVIDNDNEFTQCPEYRLREPYWHDGSIKSDSVPPLPTGAYPAGTLVHRSVHVQLKKNVMADGVAAMFG
ncbi:MAG: hypothetical protein V3V24_09675 [Nitrospinaceae bacterium]